jgi:hypothetical protein
MSMVPRLLHNANTTYLGNVCKLTSRAVAPYFWSIAKALTVEEYHLNMNKLDTYNSKAYEYLKAIDPKLWVTAFYDGPHFGHKTSNVVESTNKVFKDQRELPVLELLNSIWNYVMDQRFARRMMALNSTARLDLHTEYCEGILRNSNRWAKANTVQMSSPTTGIVTQTNKKTFLVDMIYRKCTCGRFQENGIPCGHAFSLIYCFQSHFRPSPSLPSPPNPRDFVPYFFKVFAWTQTYKSNLSPILIDNMAVEEVGAPVKERKAQGRPTKKRRVAGSQHKIAGAQARLNNEPEAPSSGPGSQFCSLCGIPGHKRRSCKNS